MATEPGYANANGTHGWGLWTVVPQLSNGWFVAGEPCKFTAASGMRFVGVSPAASGCVAVSLRGAPRETVDVCAAHLSQRAADGSLPLGRTAIVLDGSGVGSAHIC